MPKLANGHVPETVPSIYVVSFKEYWFINDVFFDSEYGGDIFFRNVDSL
jgi:hypothetical protein